MGADIHSFAEVRTNGKWMQVTEPVFSDGEGYPKTTQPFCWRSYAVFGFLAGVRNYSDVTPISECKGLPADSEWLNSPSEYAYTHNPMNGEAIPIEQQETNKQEYEDNPDLHSASWLALEELLAFDYQQTMEDKRVTKSIVSRDGKVIGYSGGCTAESGGGTITTYQEFLATNFFNHIEALKTLGSPADVRIVFWFDN